MIEPQKILITHLKNVDSTAFYWLVRGLSYRKCYTKMENGLIIHDSKIVKRQYELHHGKMQPKEFL